MFYIGLLLLLAGAAMSLLVFTGTITAVPLLIPAADAVPLAAWLGIAIIGAAIATLYRRPRD